MKNGPAYSHEEKIAIIREHEEGHKTLCEEYGISKSYLCYLLTPFFKGDCKYIAVDHLVDGGLSGPPLQLKGGALLPAAIPKILLIHDIQETLFKLAKHG